MSKKAARQGFSRDALITDKDGKLNIAYILERKPQITDLQRAQLLDMVYPKIKQPLI